MTDRPTHSAGTSAPTSTTTPAGSWPADHGRAERGAAVDVEVRAAHPGGLHRDNDLAGARHGSGNVAELQLAFAVEHNCLHAAPLGLPPRGLQMIDPHAGSLAAAC